LSYKPLKNDNEYVVQYGERTVGYIVAKDQKFFLQPSIKGYDTVVDERIAPFFDKGFPSKAALEGNLMKALKQG
jgi:hypothetical protein